MKKNKEEKTLKEKHDQFLEDNAYKRTMLDLKSSEMRGRSISVGTAFGGVTEIGIRGEGNKRLWVLAQPVEVVELIHQLAANIGCHIHIQPRKDFSSWRQWNEQEELLPNEGWAPFSKKPPLAQITQAPEQPGLQPKKKRTKKVIEE